MSNPTSSAVVKTAISLLDIQPRIPYVMGGESLAGMDCQGLVEYCVRKSGGKMSYAGSNDMIRNACTRIYTLEEARSKGLIQPGWLVFILKQDGKEPDKYKGDGIGNASHVGYAIMTDGIETIDSAQSAGGVRTSKLTNAWTHCGPAKAIDYEGGILPMPTMEMEVWSANGEPVRLRAKPSTSAETLVKVPVGELVQVSGQTGRFSAVRWQGRDGYMMTEFLRESGAASGDMISIPRKAFAEWLAQGQRFLDG